MRYLSLFSGIEAASVAWTGLGWKPVGFAEVDPFACAVLAKQYPSVTNLGDVTKIDGSVMRRGPHVVVGGFPCQDVSKAGKRTGLKHKDGSSTRSGLFFEADRIIRESGARWASSKTCRGSSPRPEKHVGKTLRRWLGRWLGVTSACPTAAGVRAVWLRAREGSSNGRCWTLDGSEYRSGASVCSLSRILERGTIAPRFYWSPKACAGILARSSRAGKKPDPLLASVLSAQAGTLLPSARAVEPRARSTPRRGSARTSRIA